MKKYIVIIFFISTTLFGQFLKMGEVSGVFMSVGVGPKIPISTFAENQNIGVGFDFGLSYVDNKILPVFFFAKLGYQHFDGSQDLYKKSDYSSFSSNVITFNGGIRYYFPPIIDQFLIVMPVVDVSMIYSYWTKLHQFKLDSDRNDFTEDISKAGFQIGGGVSMFVLDVLAYYNYLPHNQFISLDIRLRIPMFVKY